jgi:diguanylate cyclase
MYRETKEASAELLRLILQRMGGQPAAFTPPTYAIWYEFLAGINMPLRSAMEKRLEGGGEITTELAQELFDRYVSESNPEAQKAFRENMNRLLENLGKFAELTGNETERFSAGLKAQGDKLSQELNPAALEAMIREIGQDTQAMRGSVQSLQGKLEESKGEVEKLQQELQSAKSEALTDPMTKVFNRRGFEAQMKQLAANPETRDKRVSFLMLDIDFFKKINDTYGHLFGDRVICGIAAALTAQVKGQDSVARLGGEEFAVILPDTPVKGAFAVAEHIRERIEKSKIRRLDRQESIGGVTISIGIAECAIGDDWNAALSKADEALYVSKKQGRNRTTISS